MSVLTVLSTLTHAHAFTWPERDLTLSKYDKDVEFGGWAHSFAPPDNIMQVTLINCGSASVKCEGACLAAVKDIAALQDAVCHPTKERVHASGRESLQAVTQSTAVQVCCRGSWMQRWDDVDRCGDFREVGYYQVAKHRVRVNTYSDQGPVCNARTFVHELVHAVDMTFVSADAPGYRAERLRLYQAFNATARLWLSGHPNTSPYILRPMETAAVGFELHAGFTDQADCDSVTDMDARFAGMSYPSLEEPLRTQLGDFVEEFYGGILDAVVELGYGPRPGPGA